MHIAIAIIASYVAKPITIAIIASYVAQRIARKVQPSWAATRFPWPALVLGIVVARRAVPEALGNPIFLGFAVISGFVALTMALTKYRNAFAWLVLGTVCPLYGPIVLSLLPWRAPARS